MTAEETWERHGPDWTDEVEPLIYADWLEEHGEDVMAATVRWLKVTERKPAEYDAEGMRRGNPKEIFAWWNDVWPNEKDTLPLKLWEHLDGHFNDGQHFKDYKSHEDAMNAVVRAARHHPEEVRKIINEHHTDLAGPVAG